MNEAQNDAVADYYTKAHGIYQRAMDRFGHHSIHVGYFDDEHTGHDSAVENMTRVVADAVDVGEGDRVLDCGCGVGGPATWLAGWRGAEVVGLNVTPMHLERARELAVERGVADQTTFREDDFTAMESVADDSMDVVWGLEAVCYAADKREFLEQAARVLRPGGRLVVADGFMAERDLSARDRRQMARWLKGWKVPNLAPLEDFQADLRALEFADVVARDVTANVMPSSKALYYYSFYGWPATKLLQLLGRRTQAEVDHVAARYYQHPTLKRGLWRYAIVSAVR